MQKGRSGKTVGLALLVIGLAIGGGLTFTFSYAYGVLSERTVTVTSTLTSFDIITIPTIITTTVGYAVVQANLTQCQGSGSGEYCEVVLTNTGSLLTATAGNCSLTYGGQTNGGYTGPTPDSAVSPGVPQQLIPGGTRVTYCVTANVGAAAPGAQVTGAIFLASGGKAFFSGAAS